ncbi:MAG: hypothetical protein E4H36_07665 [Spirochaetales bacterium]|nr:MAG: hypothetical protein E4H36_07665 [Spirochaetales bacterium]
MHKYLFLLVLGFLLVMPLAADKHPKTSELEQFIADNPIEPRIPELMMNISQKSQSLNTDGYSLYLGKQYKEAIAKFSEAVQVDVNNSFAWYNLACCYSLINNPECVHCLKEAVTRDWFWGLQLMVDPDFDNHRYIDLKGVLYQSEAPRFGHTMRNDGTVTVFNYWTQNIGVGYYSILYGTIFEYFPHLNGYDGGGPDGNRREKESVNQVLVPDIPLK